METASHINHKLNHLFRNESGRMVSVLVKIFGMEHYDLAEDVVQYALISALESWKFNGIPENPKAWLYRVSKNKAIDVIRKNRHQIHFDFSSPEQQLLQSEYSLKCTMEKFWEEPNIQDDFLGMMYACCLPELSNTNQISFILKSLCGFSTREIAKAFLTTEDVVSKRIYRTKEFFRENKIKPEIPQLDDIKTRNLTVLNCIYLIFNEGYNSTHSNDLIRKDLISHSMMLLSAVLENSITWSPEAAALMALICFHSSRINSRLDMEGAPILLPFQDRENWDRDLISKAMGFLHQSASGPNLSVFHLEAAIAYEHCKAKKYADTSWEKILGYYDLLLKISPSALVDLNRCIALMELKGPETAFDCLEKMNSSQKLKKYYLYHSLRAELLERMGQKSKAAESLEIAVSLTHSEAEKRLLIKRIEKLRI